MLSDLVSAGGLTYRQDRCQEDPDLDSHRLSNSKQSRTRAVAGREYESALKELKWNDLGWRLGKLFGETSDELREEIFKWCVKQQMEKRG
jgi:hypothetical protein